jgi:CSLREA domain-containing protein
LLWKFIIKITNYTMQEFIVSTLEDENDGNHDAGDLSLREAIALANENEGEDTITFDSSLSGGTINIVATEPGFGIRGGLTLINRPLLITDSVNINGLGKDNLSIDGNGGGNGVFKIEGDGTDGTISGLTITDGYAGVGTLQDGGKMTTGGSISVEDPNSRLTLNDSLISSGGSFLVDGSAAIYNEGQVDLIGSTIENSITDPRSVGTGAIITNNSVLNISDSTIDNSNVDQGNTTAIINSQDLNVTNSTIANTFKGINNSGQLDVNNSTIVDIEDPFPTPDLLGIENSGTANISSSIIDGIQGSFTSDGNNLIMQSEDNSGFNNGENGDIVGTTENPIDPQLGELQDNGGATPTQELLASVREAPRCTDRSASG